MEVNYKDHMGTDLTVVNAARVSFAKEIEEFRYPEDEGLIKYLAQHKHWSPFAHTSVQLHIKAPIFVARQLGKHQVGLVWNEVSRRYVTDAPEFHEVEEWRGKPKNAKQGSSGVVDVDELSLAYVKSARFRAVTAYNDLLKAGVAPEQARMVLPQSTLTEWWWTGSMYAFARICNERLAPDAQEETRQVAEQISEICRAYFPVSWKELVG